MNNHNRPVANNHESADGPDYISVDSSNVDKRQRYLDMETIEKDMNTNRELNLKFGEISNDDVANREKAKKGPLRKIATGALLALIAAGIIIAGKVERDSLMAQKEAEEAMEDNDATEEAMRFDIGSDVSTYVAPDGTTYTAETNGRSPEEMKKVLEQMRFNDIERALGSETTGE